MSVLTEIAEAVKEELNAASLSQEFDAERVWVVIDLELKDLKVLRVHVAPKDIAIDISSRSSTVDLYGVSIGIQKKLDDITNNDEIDPLSTFVEEVADLFRLSRLTTYSSAVWERIEVVTPASPVHLVEKHCFTAILNLTFRVLR